MLWVVLGAVFYIAVAAVATLWFTTLKELNAAAWAAWLYFLTTVAMVFVILAVGVLQLRPAIQHLKHLREDIEQSRREAVRRLVTEQMARWSSIELMKAKVSLWKAIGINGLPAADNPSYYAGLVKGALNKAESDDARAILTFLLLPHYFETLSTLLQKPGSDVFQKDDLDTVLKLLGGSIVKYRVVLPGI